MQVKSALTRMSKQTLVRILRRFVQLADETHPTNIDIARRVRHSLSVFFVNPALNLPIRIMKIMKKVLLAFGTRPEVIKMAPVVRALRESSQLLPVLLATAQHRRLLDQELEYLSLQPDFDLDLMQDDQTLEDITSRCLGRVSAVLDEVKPEAVLVQGDTTTAFSVALASFYRMIPVGHVEAGLRTGHKYAPFPEEKNRCMITTLSDYHFAPTDLAVRNLKQENIPSSKIFKTGNTVVDSLLWSLNRPGQKTRIDRSDPRKLILLTAHRRESFGSPLLNALGAIRSFAQDNPDFRVVYPVHPNPNVTNMAHKILKGQPNVSLVQPLSYGEFVGLLKACHFVVTDSGGLQEEAPSLGKPVLVLRDTTERPEAVEAGCARLVGTDPRVILDAMNELVSAESSLYRSMSTAQSPFGDGTAGKKIAAILEKELALQHEITGLKMAS